MVCGAAHPGEVDGPPSGVDVHHVVHQLGLEVVCGGRGMEVRGGGEGDRVRVEVRVIEWGWT